MHADDCCRKLVEVADVGLDTLVGVDELDGVEDLRGREVAGGDLVRVVGGDLALN